MESSQRQGKQSVAMESSQLQWKTVSYNEKQLATIEDILLNVFTELAEACHPTTFCPRDQGATTVPERHMLET